MSKRHQVSRRRHYGRRQHEMNELHGRLDRLVAVMAWQEDVPFEQPTAVWDIRPTAPAAPSWAQPRGIE